MKTFICTSNAESVLTAIYDAWADPEPNSGIRLEISDEFFQLSFMSLTECVNASYEKAEKVLQTVKKRLGFRSYHMFEGALLAETKDKAQALFDFLRYAFHVNRDVSDELAVPQVMRVYELNRKARGEAHLMLGFTRFQRLENGAFFSRIGPVNDILPLIADHFAERFNTQPFAIYDEKRKYSVIYIPGRNWYFVRGEMGSRQYELEMKDQFEELWQLFFRTIAIRERENPLCQRTHCPLHFRRYMNEFNVTISGA